MLPACQDYHFLPHDCNLFLNHFGICMPGYFQIINIPEVLYPYVTILLPISKSFETGWPFHSGTLGTTLVSFQLYTSSVASPVVPQIQAALPIQRFLAKTKLKDYNEVGIPYFPTFIQEECQMSEAAIINDARVMAKGQVTIPKNIRSILGISTGDRVTFVVEDGTVRVVNSAVYALQRFQLQMKEAGKEAGMMTDEDVAAWISASRREEEAE